jgi:hypothetical protein
MKQRKEEMEPPPFSLGLAALHACYSMDSWKTPNSQLSMILSSFSLRKREKHAEINR